MEKDQIKFAFLKVKQDIQSLQSEASEIKSNITEIKKILSELYDSLNLIKYGNIVPTDRQTHQQLIPTIQQMNPTHPIIPTDTPTVPWEVKGLKSPNLSTSIGNEGVPTDRQTNRQTNQQIQNISNSSILTRSTIESNILEASEILNSLDRIKKEIRFKFKQLTSQEMVVFSTIYQLEEKNPQNTTYNQVASILHLSETSIRDYVFKIIKKGIPLKKTKINNRKVILSISSELKKIATLSTILQLREL